MSVTVRPIEPVGEVGADVDLSMMLGLWRLPNPLLLASGCAASGQELAVFNDLRAIGGVVTKSIQLQPRSGRPTPRMAETSSGMLNSIGLQGPGIDAFLSKDLSWLAEHGANAVVSIAGGSVEDFAKLATKLRGQVFACHAAPAAAVVAAVRRAAPSGVPVFAKLSPDVTDIVEIAGACLDAGADGLTLINTTLGVAIDPTTMRPVLAATTGGLSGPAIKPMAMRCVWQVAAAFPEALIMAVGGVRSGLDVLEFVLAGASAVQLGTVLFNDPSAPTRITAELRAALAERGVDRLSELRGWAHREPEPVIVVTDDIPDADTVDETVAIPADFETADTT